MKRPYNLEKDVCEEWFEENYYEAIDRCIDEGLDITEENVDKMTIEQYYFNEWYYDIEDRTIKSEIFDINNDKEYNVPKFMRTEIMSPKDIFDVYYIENKFISTVDFKFWMEKSPRCKNSKYMVVRDYMELNPMLEFRCFFFNSRVRAISQYNDSYDCDNSVFDIQFEIRDKICNFIHNSYIPYRNAIIDVYCDIRSTSNNEIFIIEMNHFGSHLPVGSCLYDWDRDKNIIFSNRKVADIRLL